MNASGDILIETTDLSRRFGELLAVDRLTLTVRAGEIVGLLGANGAGKTTALRMMAALLTPSAGQARVCGHDARRETLRAKRCLGFLSGDTLLYRRLTPREVLAYFGRLHDMRPERLQQRTEELVRQLDMSAFADRLCGKLSSGQMQRVNIARTMIHEPPVLILDEPTTALDVLSARQVLDAVRRARDEGRAILFSTHVVEEAEVVCDRIVVLHEGRIRARGTPTEIREQTGRPTLREAFLALALHPSGQEATP